MNLLKFSFVVLFVFCIIAVSNTPIHSACPKDFGKLTFYSKLGVKPCNEGPKVCFTCGCCKVIGFTNRPAGNDGFRILELPSGFTLVFLPMEIRDGRGNKMITNMEIMVAGS